MYTVTRNTHTLILARMDGEYEAVEIPYSEIENVVDQLLFAEWQHNQPAPTLAGIDAVLPAPRAYARPAMLEDDVDE